MGLSGHHHGPISREIVGWFVSTKHDTALVAAAFFDALEQHC